MFFSSYKTFIKCFTIKQPIDSALSIRKKLIDYNILKVGDAGDGIKILKGPIAVLE
jgi:hypothetical protein